MTNTPRFIVIHHSSVSRDKSKTQFKAVKDYHIRKGWGDIGYHYFIEPDGTVEKGRDEKLSGAHTSQKWMNYFSIGICLAGNFDQEDPTPEQMKSLRLLVAEIRDSYKMTKDKVKPHRLYASYKTCPGTRFTDRMLEQVAIGVSEVFQAPVWAKDGIAWAAKNKVIEKITGEPMTDYRLAAILHNFSKLK